MLDHMILTVSNVERSLAFYEAALKPLNIKFFLPYKGEGDHPDLWGFGDGKRAFFWIKQGKPDPASIHWGFMAVWRPQLLAAGHAITSTLASELGETYSEAVRDGVIRLDIAPSAKRCSVLQTRPLGLANLSIRSNALATEP